MRLQEIKKRLAKVKETNVTNIVQKEHEDIEWLVNRIDRYIRVNIKLTQDNVDLESRIERYETLLKEIVEVYDKFSSPDYTAYEMRRIVEEALKEE